MTTTYVRLAGAAYHCTLCDREHDYGADYVAYVTHFDHRADRTGKGWRYEEVEG